MTPEREQELLKELVKEKEENARLRQEIALLRQKVDLLVKKIFGASSEKLDPRQLELLLEGSSPGKPAEPELAAEAPRRSLDESTPSKHSPRGPRLPEHLPCVEEFVDPLPVQAAPEAWRYIGEEVSEQLDYEPARFLKRRLIRRKYIKRGELDAVPVIAPMPPILQERCIAAPGLLAQVVVAKYCYHVPLYRQEQIYAIRYGVILPRQTLVRWIELAAHWLGLIYRAINADVVGSDYIQMDETPIEYLDPEHHQTHTGYLWVCNLPGGEVVYHWRTSRAAKCIAEIIPKDFCGIIQCDAYAGYRSFAQSPGREGHVRLAACYAHARRKFVEAQEQAPGIIGWILKQIANLYGIEKRLRQKRAGSRLRQAIRAAQSRPIHERIKRALIRLKTKKRYLPQSSLGKAIDYTLAQWTGLSVFLEDGRVEIDDNLVENAVRPTAVGKRNWLFIGRAEAGQRGAILYTIVENCRRQRIDPYTYLRDVLGRLPSLTNQNIADWTPSAYAKRLRDQQHLQAVAS